MKKMPLRKFVGAPYIYGPLAPGKSAKKMCPNCGRRINFDADRCEGCNADRANGWKPMKLDDNCDFQTVITSKGGRFNKGELVNIYAKNGYMAFKTKNSGENFVNLERDFFLCSRTTNAFGKIITLVFSDFTINMRDDSTAEKIMIYIYSHIVDKIYEKENVFYNAEHDLFPL